MLKAGREDNSGYGNNKNDYNDTDSHCNRLCGRLLHCRRIEPFNVVKRYYCVINVLCITFYQIAIN